MAVLLIFLIFDFALTAGNVFVFPAFKVEGWCFENRQQTICLLFHLEST